MITLQKGGAMAWSGISIVGCMDLCIIRNGTLTAQKYVDKIFRHHVVSYAGVIANSFFLMQDNARHHIIRLVEKFLEMGTV